MYRKLEKIVTDMAFQTLCREPFHGHPKGCPNFGIKKGCPPKPPIGRLMDLSELYIIYTPFPVGKFAERMRKDHPEWKEEIYPKDEPRAEIEAFWKRHPEWKEGYFPRREEGQYRSSRQWYNPRRWQMSARKAHLKDTYGFLNSHDCFIATYSAEAHGVNLTAAMHDIGIELDWSWPPPHREENLTYLVSLAGRVLS